MLGTWWVLSQWKTKEKTCLTREAWAGQMRKYSPTLCVRIILLQYSMSSTTFQKGWKLLIREVIESSYHIQKLKPKKRKLAQDHQLIVFSSHTHSLNYPQLWSLGQWGATLKDINRAKDLEEYKVNFNLLQNWTQDCCKMNADIILIIAHVT